MKKKILLACLESISKEGFGHVNIKKIAEYSNLSMGDIYLYYSDIDSILEALFTFCNENLCSYINNHLEHLDDSKLILKSLWFNVLNWSILNERQFAFINLYTNRLKFMDKNRYKKTLIHVEEIYKKTLGHLEGLTVSSKDYDSNVIFYAVLYSVNFAVGCSEDLSLNCDRKFFSSIYNHLFNKVEYTIR